MMMVTQRGEMVTLTPQSWVAIWGLAASVFVSFVVGGYALHISRLEDRERLIRVEEATKSTATGVNKIAGEVKSNAVRISAAENRVQRLEDKGT